MCVVLLSRKTYVRRSDQLLSFKTEEDPACTRMAPVATEAIQDFYHWVVAVSVGVTIMIVVLYRSMFLVYYYQTRSRCDDRHGRIAQMRQTQVVNVKKKNGNRRKATKASD